MRRPIASAGRGGTLEMASRGSLNSCFSVARWASTAAPCAFPLWRGLSGGGRFIEQLVGEGVESHLGAARHSTATVIVIVSIGMGCSPGDPCLAQRCHRSRRNREAGQVSPR